MTKKNFYVIIYIQKIRKKVREMVRYFIWAAEQMYEGLHGIEDRRVVETLSYEDACDWANEMSIGVIESYCEEEYRDMVDNEVNRDDYDTEDEYWDAFDERLGDLKCENTYWVVTEVDEEKASNISTQDLDHMYCWDPEGTIENYGKPEEE